jgi:Domain of unknown function (DUF5655)
MTRGPLSHTRTNWTCAECGRRFARRNQSHTCAPGMSREAYFAAGSDSERAIFEAVEHHVTALGPVHIEYVSVGIFLKRARTFAELRPMRGRTRLSVLLPRRVSHPRVVRIDRGRGERTAHFVDLYDAAEVDDQIRDWLTEAYLSSPI